MMHTRTTPQGVLNQTHHSSTTPEPDKSVPMTILDGGMGRELEQRGAPFRQPEWSALSLSLAPDSVRDVHLDYINAGATVITVNSYAVTPYHLGDRFFTEGEALIETAAKLAFEAVQASNSQIDKSLNSPTNVKIAGCLPPLFGSYRPDLFDTKQAPTIARPFLSAQTDYVDMWLVETQSSIVEAQTWHQLIKAFTVTTKEPMAKTDTVSKPIWIAFTLDDSRLDTVTDDLKSMAEADSVKNLPVLRSGELVADAVQAMIALNVEAILFNCSQPEVMSSALKTARQVIDEAGSSMQLGVYANAFVPKQSHKQANTHLCQMREDTTPDSYLTWAKLWQDSGASIIGGCCGIGVEHIEQLAQHLVQKS